MRHLLSLEDWSPDEVRAVIDLADEVKLDPRRFRRALDGCGLAMIFLKSSTRTRVSFEVAIQQLGGYAVFLAGSDTQLGRGEPIADTARVLSRYVDVIMARLFAHSDLVELAEHATVPVINGLTDTYHPCQALADVMTVRELCGGWEGRKLAYVGDGNNMAHSLLLAACHVGLDVAIASPPEYTVEEGVVAAARELAGETGSQIELTTDPTTAIAGAHAVYTDVWASMGQEDEQAEREEAFAGFGIDAEMMATAQADAIFLHCLPCHRGEEVEAEVVDGRWSRIFEQAENRLHAQKALLVTLAAGG